MNSQDNHFLEEGRLKSCSVIDTMAASQIVDHSYFAYVNVSNVSALI